MTKKRDETREASLRRMREAFHDLAVKEAAAHKAEMKRQAKMGLSAAGLLALEEARVDPRPAALEHVRKCYEDKRRIEENVRFAVMRARDMGLSYPAIAEAAGVTHPAIMDMVKRIEAKGSTSY